MKKFYFKSSLLTLLLSGFAFGQLTLPSGGVYTENFDLIGNDLPIGWSVKTGTSATSNGTDGTFTKAKFVWNNTTGAYKNFASADGLIETSLQAAQDNSTDRALGIRQTGSFGTTNGTSFVFQIDNTTGKSNFLLAFKLQSLDKGSPRTSTWKVEYSVGNSLNFKSLTTTPSTLTTGNSKFTNQDVNLILPTDFDNQSTNVWIRITTTGEAVGSGNRASTAIDDFKLTWDESSLSETTWQNGVWSNGDPSLTKDVIIKGALEVSASLEAKTLTVSDAGGMLAVKPGGILTVDGKIDNQAGLTGLVIENGGNLIQNQNVANLGAISVNRNSQAMVRNDMTFWSSPVQQEAWQQTIRSFSPETLFNRFWTYNESTNEFSQILTSDTDSKLFEAGKGVSIRVKNTLATGDNTIQNGEFSGVPFNGDINVPVQFTASGYNLVGNPYASNINVVKFLISNTSVNSLYFWTHQFPVGSAEYANNYAAFNVVGSVIPGLSNISVGQGFIVGLSQATPTVNFNNAMRTAQDAFFYKNSIAEKNRIWLSLSKENKPVSQILLAYMDGATNGIDNQIDAKVMQRGSSAIYTLINDEAYAIQGRSLPFVTDDVVKLGFEALEQGNYSINIEQVDGLFNENQTVYLKDKELNKIYNLSESAYQFASKAGIFNDRFELVYADKTLATDDLTKNNVIVYNTNNTIVVDSKQSKIVSVELYDIQGRKVVDKNKINANTFQVQSSAKGVLVIKVLTEDGKVKTQKIINK